MKHLFFAFLVGAGLLSMAGWAQEFRSTLTGQVADSQGAAMPGVKVVAKLSTTGAESSTVTGTTGQYTLPFLPPGTYTITADAAGFRRYVNENIIIESNLHVTLNIRMEVGELAQSLTVSADASNLTTASASVGQALPDNHLTEMPSIGRAPMALAKLAFGVVDMTNPQANSRPFDNNGSSSYAMAGGASMTNELLLDGAPNMWGPQNRTLAYNPPMDAVQEVKAEVFTSDASYGDTYAGMVTLVTKGGTNQFHGTLEEFNQVGRLAASPFFSGAGGGRKLPTEFNEYGFTVGSPLYVPKVYNGKNKVFWFLAYEGVKHNFPQQYVVTVPTAAMRSGNFSPLLSLGSSYTIYDPSTGVASGGHVTRQPFPGNTIPKSLFNPIALNYLNYYPLPDQSSSVNGQNDYLANTVRHDDYFTVLPRLDFVLSDAHKLFWTYHGVYRTEHIENLFNNIATGDTRPRDGNGSTIDDLYTFNSSTFLNTRLSWNRLVNYEYRNSTLARFDPTTLGFPSSVEGGASKLTMPYVSFSDGTQALAFAVGGTQGAGFYTPYDTYQIFSTLVKTTRSHNLKFGTDLRMARQSSITWGNAVGSYSFGSGWVNGPQENSPSAPLGQSLAEFLLGLPTGGGLDRNTAYTIRAYYAAFFIQDDWRIRPNLTLNLGLRYERETGTTERYNRTLAGFDFTSVNAATAAAKAAYALSPIPQLPVNQFNPAGGAVYASSNQRNIYNTYNGAFSPRFGFAYTPAGVAGNTVLRGGFGIFYSTYGAAGEQQGAFSQTTPLVSTLNGDLTPYATLSNPIPSGIQQPVGAAAGINTYLGQGLTFGNRNLDAPYSERWTLTIQRALTHSLVLEVGYVGNRALHLPMSVSLDYVPAKFLSTLPVRDTATINALTANVANPFQGLLPGTTLNGSTVSVSQLLMAYPQFTGLTESNANLASSDFNSLEIRLQQRVWRGLEFITSFEHSRLMAANGFLNPTDPGPTRMVSGDDRPNRFVSSFVYQMPFGKGKAVGKNAGPWLNRLIGGWELSGIVTVQSSAPLGWGNVIYLGGNLNYNPGNPNMAFDTTRFNTNSSQQLANNIRTFYNRFSNLRAEDIKNFESAISKPIPIHERLRLLFRAEAFNTLNRVQFGGPSLSPTSSSFGVQTSQANSPRTIQGSLRLVW